MSHPTACSCCGGDRVLRWMMVWAWLAWVADVDQRIVLVMYLEPSGRVGKVNIHNRTDRDSLLDPGPWIRARDWPRSPPQAGWRN